MELLNEIFTRYRGVIYAVNAHIKVAISHSISECQSDENGEFAIFFTKLAAMATSIDISEKEVQIDHLHPKAGLLKYTVQAPALEGMHIGPGLGLSAGGGWRHVTRLSTA